MKSKKNKVAIPPSLGQKLLDHSKAADFTARRGLAVELYPFIFGAGQRMSSRAISQYLAQEQGVKLSAVTVNKALKNPRKYWNLYFDGIEYAARMFAKEERKPMADLLFKKEYFLKPVKHPVLKVAVGVLQTLVSDDFAYSANIMRHQWFNIEWEVRLKARQYLEPRLEGKGVQ